MKKSIVEELKPLFYPKSVAVIGASGNPTKFFNSGVTNNVLAAFPGKKYLINMYENEALGVKTYKSIKEVSEPVDTVVIIIPARSVPTVMEECVEKGVKAAVIISAGFREAGEEGAKLEDEVIRIARRGGIRFVGPNGNGIFNTWAGVYLSPFGHAIEKGRIALVSQSGNLGGYMVGMGRGRGIGGFSKFISSGNEADLNLADYLEYLGEDPDTSVIAAYIEGIKDGRRFMEVAKEVTKKKPVIALKVGRTEHGSKAAKSHTASLSGSDEMVDAAFKQVGVIRVEDTQELLDVTSAMVVQPLPRGRKVGIVTGGGGFGVIATDACESRGIEIAQLSPQTIEEIDKILPPRWPRANPVDMVGSGGGGDFGLFQIHEALFKDENVDAVISMGMIGVSLSRLMRVFRSSTSQSPTKEEEKLFQSMMGRQNEQINRLIEQRNKSGKPLLIVNFMEMMEGEVAKSLQEGGITMYNLPERAAKVLSQMIKYREFLDKVNRAS